MQIVGYGEGKMHEVVRLLHDADAPVEVGRETECGVVLRTKVAPGIEGLVADEHSLLETFPGQPFGRGETAWSEVSPFIIDNVGMAVEDTGQAPSISPRGGGFSGNGICPSLPLGEGQGEAYPLQRIRPMQLVARIEEADVVARGQTESFVHGIIQSFVRLAHHFGKVGESLGNL